jgi:hypothetical protein
MILQWFRSQQRKNSRRHLGVARSHTRTAFESLENRALLSATVAMDSLSRLDSTHIQYQYEVQTAPVISPFTVNFYRSSDTVYDGSDLGIGTDIVSSATIGVHTSSPVLLTAGFAPDPMHKYILAVATGVSTTEDTAVLRTYILGVVTHGDAPTGKFPSWVTDVANELTSMNYDVAIPFDWAKIAAIPLPGTAQTAADLMTVKVLETIAQVAPEGSWDLQMIGHSRGGSVISVAMDNLISLDVPQLNGYKRLTYLDSHPANAASDSLFNTLPQPTLKKAALGLAAYSVAIRLQHLMNDPAAFVPKGVDYAEAYFQRGRAAKVVYQKEEAILNLWGQNKIPSNGPSVRYVNLTVPGISHTGVWRLYTRSIVQSLTTTLPNQTTFVPSKPFDLRPLPSENTTDRYHIWSFPARLRAMAVFTIPLPKVIAILRPR